MPRAFHVPAKGLVDYQYFVVDPGFKHDVWIRGAEGRIGNRGVVHHMVLFFMPPGQKDPQPQDPLFNAICSSGPGMLELMAPPGLARRVPAGSKLCFQMHYTPNGSPQVDLSECGLLFADPKTIKKELSLDAVVNFRFVIPPGDANYEADARQTFDEDTVLYAVVPHMHLRGKSFRFTVTYRDGRKEVLLDVPRYDFNWQLTYQLSEPKLLPKGTTLLCHAVFDNSEANLANPDPKKAVHFGEQTWDEMMVGMFYYGLAHQDLTVQKLPPAKTAQSEPMSPLLEALVKILPTQVAAGFRGH
jgi:Copper type II ascorbate-dependent monooxygenase, C-terminal domain